MDYIGVSEVTRSVFLLMIGFIAFVRSDYSSLHLFTLLHAAGCGIFPWELALVDARLCYNLGWFLDKNICFCSCLARLSRMLLYGPNTHPKAWVQSSSIELQL